MFPALTGFLREIRSGFGTERISLDLERKDSGFPTGFNGSDGNVDWYRQNGFYDIYNRLAGGMPSWSGESVSLKTALNHSVVWACRRIVTESVGGLPLAMMQTTRLGKVEADDHPAFSAVHNAPNAEMTAMGFRETQTGHALMQGNGYSQIIRRSGTGVAMEFNLLQPDHVKPDRDKQQRLVYVVKDGNSASKTFTVQSGKPQDILHLRGASEDGIVGYSVLHVARQSWGTALATERHTGAFLKMGGRTPYHLEQAQKFKTEQEFKKFRDDWEQIYSQPHKAPILFPGLTYKQDGLSPKDSQFLEMRLFEIHEICRWFLVSPHLVGDLSRATFSNIEQLALEFVKITLSTWLKRWEQELWRCVLTPEEKHQKYFFKHNVNALLRGDFLTRMQGYSIMLQNAIANANEIRALEDWNSYEGGDEYHFQLNMQPAIPTSAVPTAMNPGPAADAVTDEPEK